MRRVGILGLAAALAAYPFMLVSIALSPWFNLYNNALSDLGNTVINGQVGYVYNAGLVLSGVLAAAFAVLLSKASRRLALIWTVPLALAGIDLALIGFFSENTGEIHGTVSVVFFLMIIVTMLAYSYVSWPLESPRVGAVALAFGILSAVIWFVHWPWSGVAIQEAVTSGMTAIFLLLVAVKMK